jgi:hyperosmotically inducible periplasmic protein
MMTQLRQHWLVTSLFLSLASGSAHADSPSQDITAARQETQIWTTYALSPYLRANDLKVSVRDGRATLTGTVEDGVNKDLAKQLALGVAGIHDVDNQIVVKSDYVPPARTAATPSFGDMVDDASITAAVKSKLLWSRYADGSTTQVETKAGKVTLTGTADSAAAKELAKTLAINTHGVLAVDNKLVVDSTKPTVAANAKAAAEHSGNDIADAWITTKVKSTYGYSSNVDGADIAVTTQAGIVTLSGKVDSGVERALAIELAKNVRGVKSVQSKGLTF